MAITDRRPTLPVVHCTTLIGFGPCGVWGMGREGRGGRGRRPAPLRSRYRSPDRAPIRLVGGIVLDLDGLLRFAVEQGASDVHLKVGSRPRLRVDGRLREGPFDTVEPADTERLATAVIPRGRAESFAIDNECDFMYGIA